MQRSAALTASADHQGASPKQQWVRRSCNNVLSCGQLSSVHTSADALGSGVSSSLSASDCSGHGATARGLEALGSSASVSLC